MKIIYGIIILLFVLLVSSCRTPKEQSAGIPADVSPHWYEILNEARWAQNAHNIQSWKVEIIDETTLIGSLDKFRMLPETDPFDRQLILSLGAFAAVAELAAAREGWDLEAQWIGPTQWSNDFKGEIPLFRWELSESPVQIEDSLLDSLSAATVKYAVEESLISEDLMDGLVIRYSDGSTRFKFISSAQEVDELKEKALTSFKKEMYFEPARNESIINTRYGEKERKENPYGITLLPNFKTGNVRFIEFFARLFPQKPESYGKQAVKMFGKAIEPSKTLLLMTTEGNDPEDQFRGGMVMQRMWMDLINRGYSLLPLSQGLQEYEEVSNEYGFFQKRLALEGETVQMLWALSAPVSGEFMRSPRLEVADIAIWK